MAQAIEDLSLVNKSSPVNVWEKVIKEVRKLRRSLPHGHLKDRP